MVQFIDGIPSRPLHRPNRRHFLIHVGVVSTPKDRNTVTINKRTYGIEPNATLYPISGPGLVPLDRGACKALGYYNDFGITDLAEAEMDRNLISPQSRERARYVLETGDRDA